MKVMMLASIVVLLVTVAAFMVYDWATFRQTMQQNLVTQARLIAGNSSGAMAFGNEGDAANVLDSLRADPHVTAAALYDPQGKLFVKYPREISSADLPDKPADSQLQVGNSRLTVFQSVVHNGRRLGTLYLQSDVTAISQRLQLYAAISLLIMLGSLLVAFWLSNTLQKRISDPIIALAETAQKISEHHNYSLRASKLTDDELGLLTDSFNDMLERIQASDSALRASEAQFRLVTDNAPVLLAHMDREYRYKFVNQPYAERHGRKPHEIIGKHAVEIVGAELFERARPFVEKALTGQSVQYELEIPGPNQERLWSHVEYTPERNAAGEVVGFVAVHTDITQRKITEQAVRESERRERERAEELAVLIEAVPVPVIIVHDPDARHMTGNHAADELVRIPSGGEISVSAPGNLKPNHFKSFKDGRELRLEELPAQRAARGEPVKDFEFDVVFDDGTVLNLLGSGTPLLDERGRPRGAVHTLVDITERKRHEAKLAKLMQQTDAQARLFDATLSSIKDLAYTFDLEGNWIYANKPLLQLWGKTLQEITGKSSLELGYPPELAERLKQQVKEVVQTGQPLKGETYFTDAAGVEDYHEYIFSPVLNGEGTVTAVCGTTRLTTERKRAESMLRQNAALFSSVVDQAPTGMYVVDGQFRLQQINARALPAFAKVEPKIGRDFGEVMEILWGTEVGEQLAGIFHHTLTTGEPYRSPRFAEHRFDLNEDKAYEWETQRVTLPDGTHGVVCYFNDITEIERNNANLAFLATIGDILLRLDTVDEILNTVCAKICDYLKLTIGCFIEINETADISKVTHEWRRPEMPSLIGTYKLSDYLSADFQETLRSGECFIVHNTATDSRTDAEKYAQLKIRSFICAPLIADGRWKFLFNIHDSKPRDWREDEIELVRELTARIWARIERVRADLLLRQNEALFAALIEEAPVGVYVINSEFRVQQINTRALPAFEKVEPKMGRTLTEVMHIQWGQEAGDELAAIFRHTLDTGEPYISPGYSNIRADLGVERTVEWQTRRVTLPNGSHGVVCYFNDITERIRSEQALMQAKTAAESANRSKDDFLAALSHELRTPLNPVLLIASDAATNMELPAETRAHFDMIRRNVELEARLIDDLLDLTRITRGKLSLDKRPLDVRAVLHDTIAIVQADVDKKKIALIFNVGTDEHTISGDAVRLQQIFWNVLKNAVKFTPGGGRVVVEICQRPESGNVAVTITDTGIGLTPDEIENIFNAFAQGDHAGTNSSHRFGGLGLGLTISKMLVELHSGAIRATSLGRDQGATFTMEFPAHKIAEGTSNPTTGEPLPTKDSPAILNNKTARCILLVEDHEPTRIALTHLLNRRNYKVRSATSVAEARILAQQENFDLVVSDIGLPDGNGYDLMAELRDKFGLKGIALSGYGMEQDVTRGQQAGFVAHLIKPVRVETLEKTLSEIA